MDYSGRVNAKKGGGGVADTAETNAHTKRRLQELLTTHVLDIESDPYVFRNHLGILECRLCSTTHVNEASYISHLSGRKHQLNLEKRRRLDQRASGETGPVSFSINSIPKRTWTKIGKPAFKMTKIRDPNTFRMGILVTVKCPKAVDEPMFRLMSYYELTAFNQKAVDTKNPEKYLYLVVSAEPYENIAMAIPNRPIIKPDMDQMSDDYWWYWDHDTKEFVVQIVYK